MQCGCCEGSITRALSRITSIRNYQVNVILARVELELDTHRLSISDLIERLTNKTGYQFEQFTAPTGQMLELLVTNLEAIHDVGQPVGVARVEIPLKSSWKPPRLLGGNNLTVDSTETPNDRPSLLSRARRIFRVRSTKSSTSTKKNQYLVRVHYDASQIGARDIFDYYNQHDGGLALAPLAPHPSLAIGAKQTHRALIYFTAASLCTLPVATFAYAKIKHEDLRYDHASMVLATIVQGIAFKEFVPNAARSLWNLHMFDMDFLIAFSSTVAYTFSVIAYVYEIKKKPLETGEFFETSTMLVTLILLGRVINELARYRAAKLVSFRSLQIDKARLLLPNSASSTNPKTRVIDARLLQYGDRFKVPAHGKVVTDGVILYGGSEIDESMITGESVPVAKGIHSHVYAGTMNNGGELIVKLTALPHENSVHKIAAIVEDAELTKPKVQALADRLAGWFVPFMAVLGIVVFVVWLLVERLHKKHTWRIAIVEAVSYGIATLIVSCPCAIGLAVPMVVLIAGGEAAKFGIIFRDPQKLEVAKNVTDVVFDKTGTLTCGTLVVVDEQYYIPNRKQVKRTLLSLLRDVKHPVATAVLLHLERDVRMNPEDGVQPIEVTNINSIPGCGVEGTLNDGQVVRAGNPVWLHLEIPPTNCTVLCVTIGGQVATFQLKDRARHTAALVIETLQARKIKTHMISGDGQGAVDDIAHALNIPKINTKSRCTPEGKRAYVRDLQQPKKTVMFIGDGTNDSIALKQANIGVHISPTQDSTSDTAKSAADIILTNPRLHDILILLDISRAAYRRIMLNFAWSALYNTVAILFAAGALTRAMTDARIPPEWAALGELVSILPIVAVAFSMHFVKYGERYRRVEYEGMKADERFGIEVLGVRRGRARERNSSSVDAGCCVSSSLGEVRFGKKRMGIEEYEMEERVV